MYCAICKEESEVYLDDDGNEYVLSCSTCILTSYEEGVVKGFTLAGGDPTELTELAEVI